MTKRERKYHSRKWVAKAERAAMRYFESGFVTGIMAGSPTSLLMENLCSFGEPPPKITCMMSEEAMDKLRHPAKLNDSINILGVEVKSSSLFPFKMEDGSMCHGVMIPDVPIAVAPIFDPEKYF